ncbi:hypothetical protein Hanom_Chr11g01044151 [Helianthus anomalus]
MLKLAFPGLYIHIGCEVFFLIWGKMRTRRQPRRRRVSDILKTLDAVDGLFLLSGSLTEPFVRDGDDNNGGVTRLLVHAVTQAFPADWRGQCSIVYQRRRRGSCAVPPAKAPTGENITVAAVDDGEGANPWIVDPCPLSEYGEVMHTPLGVKRIRMVLNSCRSGLCARPVLVGL